MTVQNSHKGLTLPDPPVRLKGRGGGRERPIRERPATAASPPALGSFVEKTTAIELEPWQELICSALESFPRETGRRLLIHGPPQAGKSIIISQRWPAWLLGVSPLNRIRLACYNLTHAERFSKVTLAIMQSPEYRALFPGVRVPDRVSAEEWSTAERAALLDANPSFKALGLGSGFVGMGADTLIIDDPYKNRIEALSETTNAAVWGWWSDVVLPRLNPSTNVVVMFHRWQDHDLAGRLLDQGGWEYLRFPALADGGEGDPTGRPLGEALSPRYPAEYLEQVRQKQGSSFYALYQGTPRAPEGDFFKRHWFKIAPALPREGGFKWVRYWDLAGGESSSADQTSGCLMGSKPGAPFYVADIQAGRWAPSDRNARIVQQAALDKQQLGSVRIAIERAPGLSREPTDNLIRLLAGHIAEVDDVQQDKVGRAEPFQSQAEAGNVYLLDADWNSSYLDELCSFPTGAHDDQVDSSSGAFNRLAALLPASGFSYTYDTRLRAA